MKNTAKVTIRVEINGVAKEFEAEIETKSNAHRVAKGVLDGLFYDAGAWISHERDTAAV